MSDRIFCLSFRNSNLSKIIEGSQVQYPTRSEYPKYLSLRSIHKVWKFQTNQRQHSTGLEWNKWNRWDTDQDLGAVSLITLLLIIICPVTSHSGQDPQNYRAIQTLYLFSVEDGCLNIWWVWPSVLWFCVQIMKYGWEQHTQSWGGWVHSTAPMLCTDKCSLLKPWLCRKNKDDVTVIRVFLLSTSIISRALPALAMERSPRAWIGSKAPNRNTPSDLSINLPTAQTLFSKRPFRWTKFSVHQNSDTIN